MVSGSPVFIIAEAGVNHNGDFGLAMELVDAAADAGADAVKFQTFDAGKLASRNVPKAEYQKKTTDSTESQLEMLRKLELPKAWHADLKVHADKRGIEFLSTAFDSESLEFLLELGVARIKVPSGELTNAPLLWRYAHAGKPLVISTGMATLAEVELALGVVAHSFNNDAEPSSLDAVWRAWGRKEWRDSLRGKVTLLHCTSQYPTAWDEVNLKAMDVLAQAFGLDVGYSDHTEGTLMPVAAVARGATLIEKHFTMDRSLPGPDHRASLEPDELNRMVQDIRRVSAAMGDGVKAPQSIEWETREVARQQVIAARDIPAASELTREDLATARCGRGISASRLWDLLGRSVRRDYKAGEVIEE